MKESIASSKLWLEIRRKKPIVQRTPHRPNSLRCTRLFVLLFCIMPIPTYAQIAYSARYYYPPASHRLSNYHIYLLNPLTKRKQQITFGHCDDVDPLFSPSGGYIAFVRIRQHSDVYAQEWLCVYSVSRHRIIARQTENVDTFGYCTRWNSNSSAVSFSNSKPLIVNPHKQSSSNFYFDTDKSPDGKYTIKWTGNNDSTIQIWRLGTNTPLFQKSSSHHLVAFWNYNGQLYSYLLVHKGAGQRIILDHIDLKTTPPSQHTVLLHLAPDDPLNAWFQFDPDQYSATGGGDSGIPGQSILTEDFSISTYHELAYFLVNTQTGLTRFLGYGASLIFSPDHKHYITVTKRSLAPYGGHRELWASRLILHTIGGKTSYALVQGLVNVDSATWCKGYRFSGSER